MPTIKISEQTKKDLEELMSSRLMAQIEHSKGSHKRELFLQIVQKKYGLTFDKFVQELIKRYKDTTK